MVPRIGIIYQGLDTESYTTSQADAGFFLRAQVTYSDNRGGGKIAEAITTNQVTGGNQRPEFPSSETGQRSVPENTPAGRNVGAPVAAVDPDGDTLVYSVIDDDPAGAFSVVSGSGQIRTVHPLNFEDKGSYRFTIQVHDGADGSGSPSTDPDAYQSVTITVEDVDEPGEVTLVTDTGSIQARVPVTAVLEDDDTPVGGLTWEWHRSPDGVSGWVKIATANSDSFTPTVEGDTGNYIRATASYTDSHGPQTAEQVSARVGGPPPLNSAPTFPSTENGQRTIAEDAEGGAFIGEPLAATDLDGDSLTYSLSGPDAALFTIATINRTSGQLELAQDAKLDFESKPSLRVVVSVTDGKDQFGDPDGDANRRHDQRRHQRHKRQRGPGRDGRGVAGTTGATEHRRRDLHRRRPGA